MIVMSKSKGKPGRPPKFPKEPGAPRSKRTFNVTLSPAMYATLESFRLDGEFKIERSEVVEKALEVYFRAKGVLPVKPKDADD